MFPWNIIIQDTALITDTNNDKDKNTIPCPDLPPVLNLPSTDWEKEDKYIVIGGNSLGNAVANMDSNIDTNYEFMLENFKENTDTNDGPL